MPARVAAALTRMVKDRAFASGRCPSETRPFCRRCRQVRRPRGPAPIRPAPRAGFRPLPAHAGDRRPCVSDDVPEAFASRLRRRHGVRQSAPKTGPRGHAAALRRGARSWSGLGAVRLERHGHRSGSAVINAAIYLFGDARRKLPTATTLPRVKPDHLDASRPRRHIAATQARANSPPAAFTRRRPQQGNTPPHDL